MGLHQKFTPLFIDNSVTLMRIVNDKKTDVGGAKHLSVLTKALQEATTPRDFFSDIWPVYVSTLDNISDCCTKGHLSGEGATERWRVLEERTRGACQDLDWVEKLLSAKRPMPGFQNRLTEAIELNQPVTSLREYYRLSDRGLTHEGLFSKSPAQLGDAKPRTATHVARGLKSVAIRPHSQRTRDDENTHRPKHFKTLEIFCGPNKSMENALKELSAKPEMKNLMTLTTDTLDVDETCRPSIWADVLFWRPETRFAPGELDFVWISVPCPEYSRAKTTAPRDLEYADAIGRAAVRILLKLRPKAFAIENPLGMFRDRDYMAPLIKFLKPTSYCKFKDFRYYKPTDIISNTNCHLPHCRTAPCQYKLLHGRHAETAQRGSSRNNTPGNSLENLHRVPHVLIQKLFVSAFFPDRYAIESYLPGDIPDRESRQLIRASRQAGASRLSIHQGQDRSGGVLK